MANPFLVLGGIAVGIVTAAFGILQVPGWVASAQDASAKNDLAQIAIGQAASLSATGYAKGSINGTAPTGINTDPAVGVTVTTQSPAARIHIDTNSESAAPNTNKDYVIVVRSASGKYFARLNGGPIAEGTNLATLTSAIGTLPANVTLPGAAFFA